MGTALQLGVDLLMQLDGRQGSTHQYCFSGACLRDVPQCCEQNVCEGSTKGRMAGSSKQNDSEAQRRAAAAQRTKQTRARVARAGSTGRRGPAEQRTAASMAEHAASETHVHAHLRHTRKVMRDMHPRVRRSGDGGLSRASHITPISRTPSVNSVRCKVRHFGSYNSSAWLGSESSGSDGSEPAVSEDMWPHSRRYQLTFRSPKPPVAVASSSSMRATAAAGGATATAALLLCCGERQHLATSRAAPRHEAASATPSTLPWQLTRRLG